MHNNVLLEFTKRIERCGAFGERAKLDFSNCDLDDRRVSIDWIYNLKNFLKLQLNYLADFIDRGIGKKAGYI